MRTGDVSIAHCKLSASPGRPERSTAMQCFMAMQCFSFKCYAVHGTARYTHRYFGILSSALSKREHCREHCICFRSELAVGSIDVNARKQATGPSQAAWFKGSETQIM